MSAVKDQAAFLFSMLTFESENDLETQENTRVKEKCGRVLYVCLCAGRPGAGQPTCIPASSSFTLAGRPWSLQVVIRDASLTWGLHSNKLVALAACCRLGLRYSVSSFSDWCLCYGMRMLNKTLPQGYFFLAVDV